MTKFNACLSACAAGASIRLTASVLLNAAPGANFAYGLFDTATGGVQPVTHLTQEGEGWTQGGTGLLGALGLPNTFFGDVTKLLTRYSKSGNAGWSVGKAGGIPWNHSTVALGKQVSKAATGIGVVLAYAQGYLDAQNCLKKCTEQDK